MENTNLQKGTKKSVAEWKELVAEYQKPDLGRAIWQIVNTLGSVVVIWIALFFTMGISWWLTIGLSVLAGLFLVRSFIIFHDCGHGSFFKSKKANNILGFISGMSVFTPYHHWRWEHAMHHATNGDLDRRGIGDIWTPVSYTHLRSPRDGLLSRMPSSA